MDALIFACEGVGAVAVAGIHFKTRERMLGIFFSVIALGLLAVAVLPHP